MVKYEKDLNLEGEEGTCEGNNEWITSDTANFGNYQHQNSMFNIQKMFIFNLFPSTYSSVCLCYFKLLLSLITDMISMECRIMP